MKINIKDFRVPAGKKVKLEEVADAGEAGIPVEGAV